MSEKQQQHKKKPTPNQTKKYSYKKTKQKNNWMILSFPILNTQPEKRD